MIDVALLAAGMWQIQPDITNAGLGGGDHDSAPPDRYEFWNPLWLTYRTPTAISPRPTWAMASRSRW